MIQSIHVVVLGGFEVAGLRTLASPLLPLQERISTTTPSFSMDINLRQRIHGLIGLSVTMTALDFMDSVQNRSRDPVNCQIFR